MATQTEPFPPIEGAGTGSLGDEAPADEAPGGSLEGGEMVLQARMWSNALLLLSSRIHVELDGLSCELPWGRLRVPVGAGRHQLRVSFRYMGKDRGVATEVFDVRGGHIVELKYQAPWLVFLPGKLRLRGQDRPVPVQEMPIGLAGSAPPSVATTPGWYGDPSDGHQRRWWDGERWTPAIFRPLSRAWKAGAVALAVATIVVAMIVGSAIGNAMQSGSDGSAALAESAEWVTVTEIDGVRVDMPQRPQRTSEPIPGTDLTVDMYVVDLGDIGLAVGAFQVPGDTRTDAAILRDAASGSAAEIEGAITFRRSTVVDGEPGLDFEMTTPREGGATVLARVALDHDLLLLVQTAFMDQDDRDVAAAAHNRMSRSIRFEG